MAVYGTIVCLGDSLTHAGSGFDSRRVHWAPESMPLFFGALPRDRPDRFRPAGFLKHGAMR